MKLGAVTLILILLLGAVECFAVQVFFVDFGNVDETQSKSIPVSFNANDIDVTIAGDTPFEVQVPAPFTVSPATGTVRRFTETTVTVTLPSTAPFGVFDKQMKIILHKKNSNPFISFPLKAVVVGFPYTLTPGLVLELGTQSQGILLVKNISVSQESFRVSSQNQSNVSVGAVTVAAGGTAEIILEAETDLPSPPPDIFTETVTIIDQRSLKQKSIKVTSHPAPPVPTQPDLSPQLLGAPTVTPPQGTTNARISFQLKVNNLGSDSVACQAKVLLDGNVEKTITIPAIPTNGSNTQTVDFGTGKSGQLQLSVKVDSNNANTESNESNNELAGISVQIPG